MDPVRALPETPEPLGAEARYGVHSKVDENAHLGLIIPLQYSCLFKLCSLHHDSILTCGRGRASRLFHVGSYLTQSDSEKDDIKIRRCIVRRAEEFSIPFSPIFRSHWVNCLLWLMSGSVVRLCNTSFNSSLLILVQNIRFIHAINFHHDFRGGRSDVPFVRNNALRDCTLHGSWQQAATTCTTTVIVKRSKIYFSTVLVYPISNVFLSYLSDAHCIFVILWLFDSARPKVNVIANRRLAPITAPC